MNFQDLHELLRRELLRRIELGSLTGSSLARQTGFRQGHVSNFLNRKRALSLEGLDRVLHSQNLTVDHLLPTEISASSASPELIHTVPVVSPSTAMDEPDVSPAAVIECIQLSASQLPDQRARPSPQYLHWQRFLAIRADAQQTAAMDPMISAGAIVVLDRHYTTLAPYRARQRTLYAVRCGTALVLRFVEFDDGRLILRPLSFAFPVQLLALAAHESPADYIVGRVCLVISEV